MEARIRMNDALDRGDLNEFARLIQTREYDVSDCLGVFMNRLTFSRYKIEFMEYMRRQGVDLASIEYEGETLLHAAASHGSLKHCEYLVAHGCDVNAVNYSDGDTPLHVARYEEDVYRFLLDQGADIHAVNFMGETPLHKALIFDRKDKSDLLIARGADLNVPDQRGFTPFDYVIHHHRDLDTIMSLLEKGGQVHWQTVDMEQSTREALEARLVRL